MTSPMVTAKPGTREKGVLRIRSKVASGAARLVLETQSKCNKAPGARLLRVL